MTIDPDHNLPPIERPQEQNPSQTAIIVAEVEKFLDELANASNALNHEQITQAQFNNLLESVGHECAALAAIYGVPDDVKLSLLDAAAALKNDDYFMGNGLLERVAQILE